jgi:ABC-type bacteriocin/lantibiotic exporter with double-glycine peptidase domain
MSRPPVTRKQLVGYLFSFPFYVMLTLMVVEAMLAAATTYMVIKAGRDVANGDFVVFDLLGILGAQSASYLVGAISWIYAERAGCRAFGNYMLRFARDNVGHSKLLHDKQSRERVEPFLTGETFHAIFEMMYQLEFALKLFLGLVFNAIVLGSEIDAALPIAYVVVFVVLMAMQWLLQNRIAAAYLENQRRTNLVTAHGYTAWDNIFSGNRYNLRLWTGIFKSRLRECLTAQIRAIVAREGLSAMSGIIGLGIVFVTLAFIAERDAQDVGLLIGLVATLPRVIEMTNDVHLLATSWNELVSVWTRVGGVAANMLPAPDPRFDRRIKFDRLQLKEGPGSNVVHSVKDAMDIVMAHPTGRVNVRGGNGSGKSTLLASLKSEIKNRAYYWPTTDRLSFKFAQKAEMQVAEKVATELAVEDVEGDPEDYRPKGFGFSSGERQLRSLQEIVAHTDATIYLLDEWDANLDPTNRAAADALVEELSHRARVVEISHRDRGG